MVSRVLLLRALRVTVDHDDCLSSRHLVNWHDPPVRKSEGPDRRDPNSRPTTSNESESHSEDEANDLGDGLASASIMDP